MFTIRNNLEITARGLCLVKSRKMWYLPVKKSYILAISKSLLYFPLNKKSSENRFYDIN